MSEHLHSDPDFIIVGAMKAGTTGLRFHLNNHSQIHLPNKELNFFNNQRNFNRGKSWYHEQIRHQAKSTATHFGEKSPAYTLETFVPKRMFEMYPNTKLIWVLRNPVDRTYSNYLHELKLGYENLSFKKALHAEPRRSAKNIRYAYAANSMYGEQIARFLEYYPKEQCFFVLFEELIQPYGDAHVLNKLFDFLNVSSSNFEFKNEVRNKTTLPKYPKLLYYCNALGLTKSWKLKKMIEQLNFKNQEPGYPKLTAKEREELQLHFAGNNAQLSIILNRSLSLWNT